MKNFAVIPYFILYFGLSALEKIRFYYKSK